MSPFINEMSARLRNPDLYSTCRRTSRTSEGRRYDIITCQRKDDPSKWQEQSYRYPVGEFSEAEARIHAKRHNAILFEVAKKPVEKNDLPEMALVRKRGGRTYSPLPGQFL